MEYQILLTKEGRKWTAEAPALPGCITWGSSKREALVLAEEAIEGWLASRRATGKTVPDGEVRLELATVRVA
ncbi:MAG: type II toxin-antitoxin system HicB family antitoxin [Dehalococcoidia bacterium]